MFKRPVGFTGYRIHTSRMSDSDDDSDRAMRLAFLMAMLGAGDLNDLRGASARPR